MIDYNKEEIEGGIPKGTLSWRTHMTKFTQDELLEVLEPLLRAHSPSGDEAEVDAVILDQLGGGLDVRRYSGGQLIVRIPGRRQGDGVLLAAHKDEIGMIVKRIEEDGKVRVAPLGGTYPWKYGEGPVEMLVEGGTVEGVLSVGSVHVSPETKHVHEAKKEKPLDWPMVYVDTKLGRDELLKRGVRPGVRVVVHRSRKSPLVWNGYVGAFGLDDKGGVAILVLLARALHEEPPELTTYLAFTSAEEVGAAGGLLALEEVRAGALIAVEIGPVEEEYGLENDHRPIVWYKDSLHTYDKSLSDKLVKVGEEAGIEVQTAVYTSAGTDASAARKVGRIGRVACLSFPTQNTHGFEVSNIEGMLNTAALLWEFLKRGEV